MAYISYDSRPTAARASAHKRLGKPFVWDRLLVIAGSLAAWAGLIAAARAIF